MPAAAFLLTVAALAALAASPAVHAADTPPAYTLRDTHVGSNIPRDMVGGPVPFDKRYEELTPEQKAVLKQDYESVKPEDETPFPEAGLRRLVTPMMKLAERDNLVGRLVASAQVGADGHARSVTIYQSPDPTMTTLVQSALADASYRPARCAGQPCAMTYLLRLEFLKP